MDRPHVARAVRTMLTPGGAAVQVDAPAYREDDLRAEVGHGRLRYPPPPDRAIEELRRRYLAPDRRAGQGIRKTSPAGEEEIFRAAGFRQRESSRGDLVNAQIDIPAVRDDDGPSWQ
jgi:hypothetical protein